MIDTYTGKEIASIPMTPFGKRVGLKKNGDPKDHPGYSKWRRKYKTVAGWMAAQPGEVGGRLLSPSPVVVTYYEATTCGETRYTWALKGSKIPAHAKIYATLAEMQKAQDTPDPGPLSRKTKT